MMGNLVSFPLLCLLNKACHDMAAARAYGPEVRRVGRFNGDDCLFQGNQSMYREWRFVTSVFGLVVNESKTMVSRHWADLNSQTFDITRRRLIAKPVLSFLLPSRNAPGEILTSVLKGISSFKKDVQHWIVNVLMRYEISLRGFTLSNIPSAWVKVLCKRKWFRRVVWDGPAIPAGRFWNGESLKSSFVSSEVLEKNLPLVDRSFPSVVGPPPIPSVLATVESICAVVTRAHTDYWTGKRVRPVELTLDRREFRSRYDKPPLPLPPTRFVGSAVRWGFLWPKALFDLVDKSFPELLLTDRDCLVRKSYPHSPYLTLRHSYRVVRPHLTSLSSPIRAPLVRAGLGTGLLLHDLLQRICEAG